MAALLSSSFGPHCLRVFFSGSIAQQQIKLMQQTLVDLNDEPPALLQFAFNQLRKHFQD